MKQNKNKRRKSAMLAIEISYPEWMTLAQAKREIRTLVSDGTNYLNIGPEYQHVSLGTVKLKVLPVKTEAK